MRTCKVCDVPVWTGFKVGDEYYCSDTHLHVDFTEEQYLAMYSEDDDHAYYSEWEEQDCDDCGTEITSPEGVFYYQYVRDDGTTSKHYCCILCYKKVMDETLK